MKKYLYNLTASKFMHHLFQDNLCYQNLCTIAMSRECIESFVSIKKKEKKIDFYKFLAHGASLKGLISRGKILKYSHYTGALLLFHPLMC